MGNAVRAVCDRSAGGGRFVVVAGASLPSILIDDLHLRESRVSARMVPSSRSWKTGPTGFANARDLSRRRRPVRSSAVFLIYHRFWLALFAILTAFLLAFNTWQAVRREDRTVIGETIAILGLTLAAPSAYYVASGSWNTTALGLWVICVLYFTSSVFYVKLRVHSLSRRREELRRQSWWRCAAYHLFLTTALLLLAATGSLDLFVLFAFIPVLSRTVWQLARPGGETNLKRVGVLEIVYSVVFLVFVTLSFRAA